MNDATAVLPATLADAAVKPVLFIHVPKTAGTTFFLALTNLFGEAAVRPLRLGEPGLAALVADVAEGRAPEVACIGGHVPVRVFQPWIDRFEAVTILRHPVARTLSLYRFLRRHNAAELVRYGLTPGFRFEEFIASRNNAIASQVNNGMVQMLGGAADTANPAATPPEVLDAALDAAVARLGRMTFGLSEAMEESFRLFEHRWGVPFALDNTRENTTEADTGGVDARELRQIVERNVHDLAFYEHAATLFRRQLAAAFGPPAAPRAGMVFTPPLDKTLPLDQVPGRQGFFRYTSGIGWIRPGVDGRLHFNAPAPGARIALTVHAIGEDYPVERVVLQLNGQRLATRISAPRAKWVTIEADAGFQPGLNTLVVRPPFTLPVRYLRPGSQDNRSLSIAVTAIRFAAK